MQVDRQQTTLGDDRLKSELRDGRFLQHVFPDWQTAESLIRINLSLLYWATRKAERTSKLRLRRLNRRWWKRSLMTFLLSVTETAHLRSVRSRLSSTSVWKARWRGCSGQCRNRTLLTQLPPADLHGQCKGGQYVFTDIRNRLIAQRAA